MMEQKMAGLKFLVVDDSLITVKKICDLLSQLGNIVVKTAATGAEAVEAYGACRPDIVTMDITMPDMDGVEATKQIRQKYPDARIIMVTSHGQEPMVLGAIKAGAKAYVLKPIDREHLDAAIKRAIKIAA